MHDFDLILTLTGALVAALVLGYLAHRIGLSPIVGYLLAGIVVGPHTPGFVGNQKLAEQLAEIGVVLLMFGVGLHFHLKDLMAVWRVALPGSIGQSIVATALGALVATSFGWDLTAGIVFGLSISVASTVVLVRVLADNRDLHTPTGRIAVAYGQRNFFSTRNALSTFFFSSINVNSVIVETTSTTLIPAHVSCLRIA
jgi:monovalent cation:H+ antiporter-2, CPA2 family